MKVNQKLHQAKLAKWVTLLQDHPSLDLRKPEDASGHFSRFSPPGLCDSRNSRNVSKDPVPSPSTLSVSIGDVRIEIGSSAPDDLVLKLIQAARYA